MQQRKLFILYILLIWFVLSFITNILGPLMPVVISNFSLSLAMAAFLPFSFFLAYGIMSVPAGFMTERYGSKISMLIAFLMTFIGSVMFAVYHVYAVALASLFIIGLGMAMLQVIINPLTRVVGGEENFAFYAVLSQLVFGSASFISPYVFTYLMQKVPIGSGDHSGFITILRNLVPANLPWISLYWLFSVVLFFLLLLTILVKLPKVELMEDEKVGTLDSYKELLKDREVILFFLGIMAYVGTEQGLANWMSKFLQVYHGYNPEIEGAASVAWFWGLMSIGCVLGLVLLKLMDSKRVLRIFTVLALITLVFALFGSSMISLWAFPVMGFFLSVMYSIIFSTALNS
ncbi:MAG: MFS transporter, partial [Bacteroidota bacterium]|nr:MFS transporter [Bacteroidota bacterium]